MMFEHRLYLPSVGPFILFSLLAIRGIGWLQTKIFGVQETELGPFAMKARSKMKKIAKESAYWLILCSIIAPLSIGAYQRNSLWNDDVGLWKDCTKKSPSKERTHHNLGYAFFQLGQWDEAGREFEEALRLNPNYALAMYNLGLVYYRKGLMDRAIHYYEQAIASDSTFPDSLYNLGIAYYQKGLYLEAIDVYQKFLRAKPDYENAHISLGLAYSRLNQQDKAVQSFEEERRVHPENAYPDVYLGDLYVQMKVYSKALLHYQKALEHPNLADAEAIRTAISSIKAAQKQGGQEGSDGKD